MQSTPTRIGLYGGSFDPVHLGHLILAREAAEQLGLNRVIFLPAQLSPHKLDRPPADADSRVAVLRAATEGEDLFSVDDREVRRGGVSFTIDTVRELLSEHPGCELFYFIGDDNLAELHTWKEIDALRGLVQFVVLGRGGTSPHDEFPVIQRRIDISSTDIRNRVARGLSIRYLVPEKAELMIIQRKLYVR